MCLSEAVEQLKHRTDIAETERTFEKNPVNLEHLGAGDVCAMKCGLPVFLSFLCFSPVFIFSSKPEPG